MTGRWLSIGPFECLVVGIIAAVLLAVLLLAAFLVARVNRGAGATQVSVSETPLEVLRRRLAAGEITSEQFDELRRRLES